MQMKSKIWQTDYSKSNQVLYYGLFGLLFLISFYLYDFLRWSEHDLLSFENAIKILAGENHDHLQSRLTKPLPLILPAVIYKFTFIRPAYLLLAENICIISLFAFVLDKFCARLHVNNLLVLPLFALSGPFAIFSTFAQTDIWGWLIELCIIYLALFKRHTFLFFLLLLAGALSKESVLVAALFYLFTILFEENRHKFLQTSAVMILTVISTFLITKIVFEDSSIDRAIQANDGFVSFQFKWNYLQQVFRTIDLLWIPIVLGFRSKYNRTIVLTAGLFFLLAPFFKFFVQDRILFMIVPVLLPIYIEGVKKLPRKWIIWPLAIVGFLSTYLIYRLDIGLAWPLFILFVIGSIYTLLTYKAE